MDTVCIGQYSVIRKGDIMEYEELPPLIPPPYNYNEVTLLI